MKKYEQINLFNIEETFTAKILNEFNKLDGYYKNSFYLLGTELEYWETQKNKVLTIELKSNKVTGYNETSFTQFNKDKTKELQLHEEIQKNEYLKKLNKDKDFNITITPTIIFIFFHNFEKKGYT